jgi:NTE family protein
VFPPVKVDGKLLCDIGVLNSVPTLATRKYETGCVVAVDVSSALQPLNACETAVDVLVRMNDIGENLFRRHVADVADVVIRPDVGGVPWFDFSSPEQLIALGRAAARQSIASIESTCCSGDT